MSFEHTDVGNLDQRLSEIGDALGDVTVSAENGETLQATNCQQENKPKLGDCYIFDYQKFLNGERLHRPGSEKDVKRLKHDFAELDFNVYDYLDSTKQQTKDKLEKAAKNVSKQSKCFVCCFLTHGGPGRLLMKNTYLEIDDILKFFARSACGNLAGKPKIFIFQACRGCSCEEGVSWDSTDDGSVMDNPDYLDFLLVYSTYEGKYSFKTKDEYVKENNHGSYFIDELCRTLEQFSDQLDLLQILTIVNYRVARFFLSHTRKEETNKKKQMPCFTSRLTTEVKFNKEIPMFVSDDTKHFDRRRNMSGLGWNSTENPLEDKQIYKIQNSKGIKFLYLLNTESKFGRHWADCVTSLYTKIAARGYERKELKDWSKTELENFLKVAAQESSKKDCLICFVACQAEGDDLYDKKGKPYPMRKIVEQFTGKVCSNLRGKPKIFIFLTSTPPEKSSTSAESTDGDDYYNMIPVHSDLLEVAITIQESHQLDGVIKKLCNIFEKKSSEDFLTQLTRMNKELVKECGFYSPSNEKSATFCLNSTLTKTLILNKPK